MGLINPLTYTFTRTTLAPLILLPIILYRVLASEATNGTENGFIVFIAYDAKGNRAIVNPIWIDTYGVPRELTHTTTIKETMPVTYTETITKTSTITSTYTETTTAVQTSEVVRYDITIALAIVTLIIGLTIGFLARRKK